ncbi:hypothetical protein GGR51DRAFT_556326 [Nemania sp. FL0031]|nr:hypothetical protein GGR51DRAFT_556326 [Nemania sp. FL0031]
MARDERTPLLVANGNGNGNDNGDGNSCVKQTTFFGPANRILLAGFLMSFTLGITQVPIVYVFRLMECDIFYTHNPPFAGPADERCHRREIDAGTALQITKYCLPITLCI